MWIGVINLSKESNLKTPNRIISVKKLIQLKNLQGPLINKILGTESFTGN